MTISQALEAFLLFQAIVEERATSEDGDCPKFSYLEEQVLRKDTDVIQHMQDDMYKTADWMHAPIVIHFKSDVNCDRSFNFLKCCSIQIQLSAGMQSTS